METGPCLKMASKEQWKKPIAKAPKRSRESTIS